MGNECVWLQWLQGVDGESSSCKTEYSFFPPILSDIFHTREYINLSFFFMQLGFSSIKQVMLNKSVLLDICC